MGTRNNHIEICGVPSILVIGALKTHKMRKETKLIAISMNKDKTTKLAPSLSSFGNMIASSYLPVEITAIIAVTERKTARTPKSSGEYNRVKIGEIKIGTACAIVVPVINVNTFLANPLWGSNLCNFCINFLHPLCSANILLETQETHQEQVQLSLPKLDFSIDIDIMRN